MRHIFPFVLLALFTAGRSAAQHCQPGNRYSATPVFPLDQVDSMQDVPYANVVNWQGQSQTLRLNVFFPKLSVDTVPLRPLIIMIHGGGFVNGSKEIMDEECLNFAQRGFVAATIQYRLGHNCNQDTLSYDKAVYRAMQDAKAAFRFAVENAQQLRIDTAWMFVGGGSAGGGAALGLVYLSQAEWDAYSPPIVQQLGNLDNSGNPLTHTYTLKGVFNNWAAVGKDYIQPEEMLPMVAFQGDADPTVDIDSAYGNSCINPPMMYGPRTIHHLLTQNGVCSDLTVEVGGDHGIYGDPAGTAFRVSRASCFFKSLFCADCTEFYSTDSIAPNCSQATAGLVDEYVATGAVLYPNPASEQVFVYAQALAGSSGTCQIMDMNGRTVYRQTIPAQGWNSPLAINTADWATGLYVVVLTNTHTRMAEKLLVE